MPLFVVAAGYHSRVPAVDRGLACTQSKQPQSTILGADVVSVEFYDRIKHGRVSSWPTPHRFVIIVRQHGQRPRRYYICAEEKIGLDDWGAALQFYLKLLRAGTSWVGSQRLACSRGLC